MKKLIAGSLILAAMLPIALITGCGSSNSPTSNATSTPTVAATTTPIATVGPASLNLASAISNNFAVMTGTGNVTNSAETIYGNLGVDNAAVPTGAAPVYVGASAGNPYLNVVPVPQAMTDVFGTSGTGGAYNTASVLYPTPTSETIATGGTTSLGPGVYSLAQSSIAAGTNLTLENASGNPNNAYIFFVTGFLNMGANCTITLHNVKASNVFWVVNNYITFGADSTFAGIVMAGNYVTFAANVALEGRVFAENYVTFSGTGTGAAGVDSITNP